MRFWFRQLVFPPFLSVRFWTAPARRVAIVAAIFGIADGAIAATPPTADAHHPPHHGKKHNDDHGGKTDAHHPPHHDRKHNDDHGGKADAHHPPHHDKKHNGDHGGKTDAHHPPHHGKKHNDDHGGKHANRHIHHGEEKYGGFAEDEDRPDQFGVIYGHGHIGIHADAITHAPSRREEIKEVFIHSNFATGMALGHGFSINSSIHVEGHPGGHEHGEGHGEAHEEAHEEGHGKAHGQAHSDDGDAPHAKGNGPMGEKAHNGGNAHADGDAIGTRNRVFTDTKLLIEELTLDFDYGPLSFYVGKFNPPVGFDYENFPGIYTYHVIEEYTMQGRLGIGGTARFDPGFGEHRIDVAGFAADKTFLGQSLITRTRRLRGYDGGVSNTGDLSSFSGNISGAPDIDGIDELYYRIGWAKQATDQENERDEWRYSLSLYAAERWNAHWRTSWITEYTNIRNIEGHGLHDRDYATFVLKNQYRQWNLVLSHTLIGNTSPVDEMAHDGHVFQVSGGFQWDNGFGMEIGYRNANENNTPTERVGIMWHYMYGF